MVRIRLSRRGSKKRPFYDLTVADQRYARDGRFIERVGYFDPLARDLSERLKVKLDRVDYWLSMGGQASERVARLVDNARRIEQGLPPKVKRKKVRVRKSEAAEAAPETEVVATEAAATEAAAEPVAEVAPEVEVAPEPVVEVAPEPVVEVAPEPVAEVAPEVEAVAEPVAEVAPEDATEEKPSD